MKEFVLTLKILIALIPLIFDLVNKRAIRSDAEDEVLQALNKKWGERIAAAKKAQPNVPEDRDPFNRDNA